MKRIAIFCDGTWNRHDAVVPTHVVRLAQAVPSVGSDNVLQVPIYLPGVGIGQGVTRASRFTDRVFGGAFGWGLDDRIQEAYRHLIFLHDPGDEIYIFGFSRGAYTARSLAGLIRTMGIPPKDRTDLIPAAMELYRKRGDREARVEGIRTFTDDPLENLPPYPHPDSAIMMHERAKLSPDTPTSGLELLWRERQGMAERPRLRIAFLGVWDTVGALGLPGFLGWISRVTNHRYAFHDADLSSSVVAARHAVAIDERRRHFPPALWRNLDELNAKSGSLAYLQQWFPGNHRILGGGGTVPELSAYPTEWIAAGASAQGLTFDPARLSAITAMKNPTVSDEGAAQRPEPNNLFGIMLADRELLIAEGDEEPRVDQVSDAARERARRMGWRPPPLLPIIDEIV
ncbi:DUF2235 domain-containing protein [Maritimibacter dapengensis]|uniref:DUF2235 domain-containing protein n=1 Tax=Maritimibacter dapengensis TaxID=2836868 RepID=A0ABS6SZQ3_9RHOB|nr:DUF2235 domain-containing protein [Maritimibacter dapengensis]MBV7378458.1 DUF2235 domain-containing protein [Maritimibacter dapengensis]